MVLFISCLILCSEVQASRARKGAKRLAKLSRRCLVRGKLGTEQNMANDLRHSIKVVARKTGLSPHLIRAWEKRYATINPERNDGNRRLYSTDEIERLALLKRATDAGHSIGDIAQLPTERLAMLVAQDGHAGGTLRTSDEGTQGLNATAASQLVADAYAAVEAMDSGRLEAVLDRGSVVLGQVRLLSEIIVPLVQRIGEAWRNGELKVAHEHVASACIRTFLGQVSRPMAVHPGAPVLVSTTPTGQLHELGAILVAASATTRGWRVIYAGASLPSEEIVSVVRAHNARAVALSIVHPEGDPLLPTEIRRLRRLLPEGTQIVAGGRAAGAYQEVLAEVGATQVVSLTGLSEVLDALRRAR